MPHPGKSHSDLQTLLPLISTVFIDHQVDEIAGITRNSTSDHLNQAWFADLLDTSNLHLEEPPIHQINRNKTTNCEQTIRS
jgi:hypothetical protein